MLGLDLPLSPQSYIVRLDDRCKDKDCVRFEMHECLPTHLTSLMGECTLQ